MFGKLKEKLQSWTKKISEKIEEFEEEPKEQKKEEKTESKAKKQKSEKPGHEEKPKKQKLTKAGKKEAEELEKAEKESEEALEEEAEEKEIKKAKEQEIKIEHKIEVAEKIEPGEKKFFEKITSKISKVKLSDKEFDVYAEELEMLLLENNVAYEVAGKIIKELKERIVGKELLKKEVEEAVKDTFKDIIREILINPIDVIQKIREKSYDKEPYIMLFCGINGSGKTTTVAKIAEYLKNKHISCVLAAGDTFRAASIEQLKKHADKLGIKIISSEYGADPASVAFDAIQYAKKNSINCVLIDTAGRMHTATNLLREIEKVARVCKPDLKLFIGESITGNDAIEQVKAFNSAIGIDGIILTKADVDEKGGTALSLGYITKKPILYLGTGQEYDAIEVFDKEKFIQRLGLD
jgi:fused signal recognition particle receptor